ncbi:Lysosome-associated membrane glycoprotein 1 [Lamellibrachia satsuma]|nr:Lysosome-associated membrane glycoprotein 1 [Lamellibrachia satsuma]
MAPAHALASVGSTDTTTTTKPKTTTTKPTTTTTKPTTTTTKPTTTTTKPMTTTSKPKTTSTTAKPVSTTAKPVSTTAKPAPKEPAVGNWTVRDEKQACVLFTAGIRFTFQYVNSMGKNVTTQIDLPSNNKTSPPSGCGSTETLAIDFLNNWQLRVDFNKTSTKTPQFYINSIQLTFPVDEKYFPGANASLIGQNVTLSVSKSLYKNDVNTSYQCNAEKKVTGFGSTLPRELTLVSLETVQLKFEAFRVTNTTDFSASNPCPEDVAISNIVPIAVGAALAGLVVIVLIAYLIGRRRTKRGYESV